MENASVLRVESAFRNEWTCESQHENGVLKNCVFNPLRFCEAYFGPLSFGGVRAGAMRYVERTASNLQGSDPSHSLQNIKFRKENFKISKGFARVCGKYPENTPKRYISGRGIFCYSFQIKDH